MRDVPKHRKRGDPALHDATCRPKIIVTKVVLCHTYGMLGDQEQSLGVTPDSALDILRNIIGEFKAFVSAKGAASEADTRVKVIDKIFSPGLWLA